MLCNTSERKLWQRSPSSHRRLYCPVWFELFGLILVMPRCEMLAERNEEFLSSARLTFKDSGVYNFKEAKFVNLGYYKERLVSVDYANYYLVDINQILPSVTSITCPK